METAITKDKQELERLEGVIQENIGSFYEVGRALMEIRDRELYKITTGGAYQTFEAYCKAKWDISRPRAYQLIEAVDIQNNLSTTVDIPERQLRPLARLASAQQREAWQKAIDTAPGGKVTAAHVYKVVKGMTGKEKTGTDKAKQKSARYFSNIAINALKKIDIGDPAREDEFSRVTLWIVKNRRREK